MADNEGKKAAKASEGSAQAAVEATKSAIQENKDVEEEQGFAGIEVDPTPNEHYTVKGVLAGKPTPETDPEHAAKVYSELRNR